MPYYIITLEKIADGAQPQLVPSLSPTTEVEGVVSGLTDTDEVKFLDTITKFRDHTGMLDGAAFITATTALWTGAPFNSC